jgi:hypothetical protein
VSRLKQITIVKELASEGILVFPQGRNKIPLIRRWTELASSDLDQIDAWAKEFPTCNFAALCGKKSNLLVVDLDVKAGENGLESWADVVAGESGWQETLTVQTPSGGRHFYYEWSDDLDFTKIQGILPGVEVIGSRQCVTLPGSFYESGAEYLISRNGQIAEMPPFIFRIIESYITKRRGKKDMFLAKPLGEASIKEGGRHRDLRKFLARLKVTGVEKEDAFSLAVLRSVKLYDPPEDESVIRGQVEQTWANEKIAETGGGRINQATEIVDLFFSQKHQLIHDDDRAYVLFEVDDHVETVRVHSKPFRSFLSRLFYDATGKVPGGQALQDAIAVITGEAIYIGEERKTYVRVAGNSDEIWIDLGRPDWKLVHITPGDWEVVPADGVNVVFRRSRGMGTLPLPAVGGDFNLFRNHANIGSDEDWLLFKGFILSMFSPRGPYPVLVLGGEQGSAKSTTAKRIRSVIDPNTAPNRSLPRSVHDLVIAAAASWVVSYDQISQIRGWLSDAICSLSTGGGLSTRELFSDEDEIIFNVMRPTILNGLGDLVERSDLLDRALWVTLPRISDDSRVTTRQLDKAFERDLPNILGGACDLVSYGLDNIDSIDLPALPRMADFCVWAMACLGPEGDRFYSAYIENSRTKTNMSIEASPVAGQILEFTEVFSGTASELLDRINNNASESVRNRKDWPKTASALSSAITRIMPDLRAQGLAVERRIVNGRRIIDLGGFNA